MFIFFNSFISLYVKKGNNIFDIILVPIKLKLLYGAVLILSIFFKYCFSILIN